MTISTDLRHPAIGAALSTAATLLGMEVVFIGGLTDDTFTFERVYGSWPGVTEGTSFQRVDSFCARMLAGAAPSTADAEHDPDYVDTPARERFGVRSYVGVPIRNAEGVPVGTLCGVDRGAVEVDEATLAVFQDLAQIIEAHLEQLAEEELVIRRTPAGWRVQGEENSDLTSAMVLADLIAGELGSGGRPTRPEGELDEVAQLRLSVTQLEHALAARVIVEQAIGVLAERQHISSRAAFERLRKAARSRGRRVHDLARQVVASVSDHAVPLPPELAGRR